MTDKNENVEKPEETTPVPEEVTEPTPEETPTAPPTDEKEQEKESEGEEETPNAEEDPAEETPADDNQVPELRIVNHPNGQVTVSNKGFRLNRHSAIAVFSAKGYDSLLQVIKSNRIKPGSTWVGNLEDLKDAPKGRKKK